MKKGQTMSIVFAFVFLVILGILMSLLKSNTKKSTTVKLETFSDIPTLRIIYAYSKTCPHCIKFQSTFDTKTKEFVQEVKNVNVNVIRYERSDMPSDIMDMVDGFPTVLVFKDDAMVKKMVGNMSGQDFIQGLKSVL